MNDSFDPSINALMLALIVLDLAMILLVFYIGRRFFKQGRLLDQAETIMLFSKHEDPERQKKWEQAVRMWRDDKHGCLPSPPFQHHAQDRRETH